MIGVAFGIHETFGAANDIERVAATRVASHFARMHGLDAERLVERCDAAFASPSAAAVTISAAFEPALSTRMSGSALEGFVRSVGASVAVERFEPDDDVADVLRALSTLNVPRAALSLRWPGVDRMKAEAAGFDGSIVYAGDVTATSGALTPFVRLAAELRLPADQIFFVGTDPMAELHPAFLAGMRTVRLDRDGAPYPADIAQPEFTIASMKQLLPILSGPYTQGLLALRDMMRTTLDFREGHFVPEDADVFPTASPSDGSDR